MAEGILAYLPQHPGLLPWWLLITSLASIFNTYKSYSTLFYSRRLFAGPLALTAQEPGSHSSSSSTTTEKKPLIAISKSHPLHDHWPLPPYKTGPTVTVNSPITPFGARSFGGWNLLSAIIRFYAAYHTDNKQVYELVMWSYAISTVFVCSEVWIYGTARVRSGWFAIVAVGVPSLIWTVIGNVNGWYGQGP